MHMGKELDKETLALLEAARDGIVITDVDSAIAYGELAEYDLVSSEMLETDGSVYGFRFTLAPDGADALAWTAIREAQAYLKLAGQLKRAQQAQREQQQQHA